MNPNPAKKAYEEALNKAKGMYVCGYNNLYIELQLAEKNIDGSIIDSVLIDINKLRKQKKRHQGVKELIYGASFIIITIVISYLSVVEDSPVRYILYGLPILGVILTVKGIGKLIGL